MVKRSVKMVFKRIKDLREDKDMSQVDVSKLLNMHTSQYQRYERGESKVPLEFAVKLAKYYNVSIDYIAGLTNNKHSYKEWE